MAARSDGSIGRRIPAGCARIADATKWASCRESMVVRFVRVDPLCSAGGSASTDALALGPVPDT
ncbi:hypothetical protein [Kibdelosporangium philippinense]|uniref:hypothetical protein n=1 Tax=Kibdelosporangium philippinense TaxID=211113 RepID=UPI00361185B8